MPAVAGSRDPELASRLAVADVGAPALLEEVRARLVETLADRDDWRRKAEAADERERALLADMRKPRRW
jgi:hypothetical protein